jgi:hypothetical protein
MREFTEEKNESLVSKYLAQRGQKSTCVFSVMDKIGEAARKGDVNFIKVGGLAASAPPELIVTC